MDEAEGSGCAPGQGTLPDGEWFGYATAMDNAEIEFDLACWFTGDAAARAAAEDGEESPPPNDYYVRNENPTVRTLSVSADASVIWYPEFGDPESEATATFPQWIVQVEQRDLIVGVWIEIDSGRVASIHEQWVP